MNPETNAAYRLGPIALAPGVRPHNALTYLYAAFASVALTSFISIFMPYVLNVNLALPTAEQGRVTGELVFYGEIIMLATAGMFGAWSDQYGRKVVFVGGLLALGAGYIAIGFASSLTMLFALRVCLALGITAVSVMVSAIQVDYPAEESRGKLMGFTGIAIGIGAVIIGVVFARLPDRFTDLGISELIAGRYTLFTIAICCGVTALVLSFGLVGGKPPYATPSTTTRQLLLEGINTGRRNPKILLAYGCGFVGRADLIVVGTFYSLWVTQAGIAAGLGADAAARTAGALFAMVMTAALLWAPVMGWLNDRLDRTTAMAISLTLAAVGYSTMGLIHDPLGGWIYPASVVLGIGQMSVTLSSQTLLGQEAPKNSRGAVVGTFTFFGAAGILFVTGVGGRLYDAIDPSAPFVLIGVANGLLAFAAFGLARRIRTT